MSTQTSSVDHVVTASNFWQQQTACMVACQVCLARALYLWLVFETSPDADGLGPVGEGLCVLDVLLCN